MALTYHPDKNPTPQAETVFKELNEAYEVLGDAARKVVYDQMLRGERVETELPPPPVARTHRDPRYQPRPGAPKRPSKRQELLAMMEEYLSYAILASRVALVFSMVLAADFIIPKVATKVQVVGYTISSVSRKYERTYQLELSDGSVVKISKGESQNIKGNLLTIYRTSLLGVPYKIEDKESNSVAIEISIYGNFIFAPLILLATALAGSFYKRGTEFRFNLGIVNFFMTLLNIVFLQVHKF